MPWDTPKWKARWRRGKLQRRMEAMIQEVGRTSDKHCVLKPRDTY